MARWYKLRDSVQAQNAVARGRHATRGRKVFDRLSNPAHQGHVGTVKLDGQTFEEFCDAQRILLEHRLNETDEERERRASLRNTHALLPQDYHVEIRGRV